MRNEDERMLRLQGFSVSHRQCGTILPMREWRVAFQARPERWRRLLILAALLIGFALRLYQLGADSLWYDETVSVFLARQSVPALIAHTARDIHPPGYYLLLHGWQLLTQPTLAHGLEFLFAWPSLWFGMLLLPLLYAIGRRLFGSSVAIVTLGLAAINPFALTYSQEVRMYTLGAALGLLCLWATLQFVDRPRLVGWLAVYVIAAASGMYTLYYFAFLLAALNLIAPLWIWLDNLGDRADKIRRTRQWIVAQVGVALLWLPWLPIFWRQVTDPPVPPWRVAWQSIGDLLHDFAETLDALVAGHAPPGSVGFPWSIVALLMIVGFLVLAVWDARRRYPSPVGRRRLLSAITTVLYCLAPIGLLYLITAIVTPIYHVRYLFIYAPMFLLVAAWLVVTAWRTRHWLGTAMLAGLVVISISRLVDLWFNPLYRDGDHRQAVAALADAWRPGDVIIANAGWIYPILDTYWPTELMGAHSALPPPLGSMVRLSDYTKFAAVEDQPDAELVVVLTGNVDGDPSLGWGDPAADFYALSATATAAALDAVARNHARLWHYRLFDTVNDPTGVIRTWLAHHTAPLAEQPITGRDLGMVQLFATTPMPARMAPAVGTQATFGDVLLLTDYALPATIRAGSYLYAMLTWDALPGLAALPADVSMSLRLYDSAGRLVAQRDETPAMPTRAWKPGVAQRQPLALPIPAGAIPGRYNLELIAYRQDTAVPLALLAGAAVVDGQRLLLGQVDVQPAIRATEVGDVLARFDYIDLISASVESQQGPLGKTLEATLLWDPRPNTYRDTYQAVFTLHDQAGQPAQTWTETLGGHAYPSGNWPENFPVRDPHTLLVATTVPPGNYALILGVQRTSDGQPIPASQGWLPYDALEIGHVIVD